MALDPEIAARIERGRWAKANRYATAAVLLTHGNTEDAITGLRDQGDQFWSDLADAIGARPASADTRQVVFEILHDRLLIENMLTDRTTP